MNFDDAYLLKLSIKLSDYENALKHFKKSRNKFDQENEKNLALFNTDFRIFNLYKNYKIYHSDFLLNLIKNPFNNFILLRDYLANSKIKMDEFYDEDKSVMLTLLTSNISSIKKLKTFEFLLKNENFDFNVKNKNGQTNSQILVSANPTDMDSVYLEKIEKLMQNKNMENKFLFYPRNVNDLHSNSQNSLNSQELEKSIREFVKEPKESFKINFADIELSLLKLNLKLRRMYEFDINDLSSFSDDSAYTKMHTSIMNNFIFDKLLLDKI
jgi:hypothetical protein